MIIKDKTIPALWEGKKVVVDRFLAIDYFIEIEGYGFINGKVKVGAQILDLSDFSYVSSVGAIHGGIFRYFSEDIPTHWFMEEPQILEGPYLFAFIERHKNDLHAPPLIWKDRPKDLVLEPLPILKLKDQIGAFADLLMDYGPIGRKETLHRALSQKEKVLEDDLLQTSFVKKPSLSSQFYCPLNKVTESLKFLLEMGWHIEMFSGKRLVLKTAETKDVVVGDDHLLIDQIFQYGDDSLEMKEILPLARSQSRFFDLGENKTALLEFPPGWSDVEYEVLPSGKVKVSKFDFGFFEAPQIPDPSDISGYPFAGSLFPYQKEGAAWLLWLYQNGLHGLLADEMGLGKTVQIIAFLATLPMTSLHLVVAPSSLLFNWRRELAHFMPDCPVYIHNGAQRSTTLPSKGIVVTSYALLRQDHELFESHFFETIVLDEAQVIKNQESITAQIAYRLTGRMRVALTGTPIENRLDDLCSIFHFILPQITLNFGHIKQQIRPFMLRRTKEKVGIELPEKFEQVVYVEMSDEEREKYQTKAIELKSNLSQNPIMILESILRLRQLACHPKLAQVIDDTEEVVLSGRKVIIYSQFTEMLNIIAGEIEQNGWSYVRLDGSTRDRETPVDQFQNDPATSIFLISLKAGGVGLNLTAADYVFIYDPWWNEAAENQAISRAHRLGRTSSVIARRYVTQGTIEEKVMALKESKRSLSDDILSMEPLSVSELQALI